MAAKCCASVDGIGPAPVPVCPFDNVKLQVAILVHQTLEHSSRIQIQHDLVTLDTPEDINRSQRRVSSPIAHLNTPAQGRSTWSMRGTDRLRAIAAQAMSLVSRDDLA